MNNPSNKLRIIAATVLATLWATSGIAQGTEKAIDTSMLSYFTGGFALIFAAVFAFSFTIKTIKNSKSQQWSSKQILHSSLRLALVSATVLIIVLYFFLRK